MTITSCCVLNKTKGLQGAKQLVLYGSSYGTMLTGPTLILSLSDLQTL